MLIESSLGSILETWAMAGKENYDLVLSHIKLGTISEVPGGLVEAASAFAYGASKARHGLDPSNKNPWPEAECVIKLTPKYAYRFAVTIIQGRWPEGENSINSDSHYAAMYSNFLRMKDKTYPEYFKLPKEMTPTSAIKFVLNCIKFGDTSKIPDLIIQGSACFAYEHVQHKGRWRKVEPIFKLDAKYAHDYAIYVLKHPWPEAENIIYSNPELGHSYEEFLNEGEFEVIPKRSYVRRGYDWTTADNIIVPEFAYLYAKYVLQSRWLEAEHIINSDPKYANLYSEFINEITNDIKTSI